MSAIENYAAAVKNLVEIRSRLSMQREATRVIEREETAAINRVNEAFRQMQKEAPEGTGARPDRGVPVSA